MTEDTSDQFEFQTDPVDEHIEVQKGQAFLELLTPILNADSPRNVCSSRGLADWLFHP